MTYIVAVGNAKGGVGKTTLTVGIAGELAARGRSVLIMDFDPQGHATSLFNQRDPAAIREMRSQTDVDSEFLDQESRRFRAGELVDAIIEQRPVKRYCRKTHIDHLSLLPGGEPLIGLNNAFMRNQLAQQTYGPMLEDILGQVSGAVDKETWMRIDETVRTAFTQSFTEHISNPRQTLSLRNILRAPELTDYDYILIDCGPTAIHLVSEVLGAATHALCVTIASGLGRQGTLSYLDYLTLTREGLRDDDGTLLAPPMNPRIQAVGIVVNNVSKREKLDQEYLQLYQDDFGPLMFPCHMHHDTVVARSNSGARTNALTRYAARSKAAKEMIAITDEFIRRIEGETHA